MDIALLFVPRHRKFNYVPHFLLLPTLSFKTFDTQFFLLNKISLTTSNRLLHFWFHPHNKLNTNLDPAGLCEIAPEILLHPAGPAPHPGGRLPPGRGWLDLRHGEPGGLPPQLLQCQGLTQITTRHCALQDYKTAPAQQN